MPNTKRLLSVVLVALAWPAWLMGWWQVHITGNYSAGSSVVIEWNVSAGATSYNVYRGASGGAYLVIATGVTDTTYTDSHVEPHKQSCYVITAVNGSGETGNSAQACANVP